MRRFSPCRFVTACKAPSSSTLRMNVLSLFRPATPLGAPGSYVRFSLIPAISSTIDTRSLMEISSLEPRFSGVAIRSGECMIMSMPSTQSSMKQKLRVCEPSPQISIALAPGVDRFQHLPAHCGGGFLAASEPCPVRPVDVVEAGDVGLQTALGPILLAEHLRDQLLPAVAALGHRGIRVALFQRRVRSDLSADRCCKRMPRKRRSTGARPHARPPRSDSC